MRALLAAILLAAAGVGVAYRWFPAVDSLGHEPARISREEAIERARSLALRYGRNVEHWPVLSQVAHYSRTYEILRFVPNHPLAHLARSYCFVVHFSRGPLRVRVELSSSGMPVDFSFWDGRQPEFRGKELAAAEERQVLADFAGEADRAQFRKIDSVNRGTQGHVTTWEWKDEDRPEVIQHLEVSSAPDGIRRAVMKAEFSSAIEQRWLARFGDESFRVVALLALIILGICLTNALFFAGLARGHVQLKPALVMLAGLFAVWVVGFVLGTKWEQLLIDAHAGNQPVPERLLQRLLMIAATMPLFPAMWAVGRALMRKSGLERWQTLDALVAGSWWRLEVGRSVSCGLLLGAALTAIPVALGAAGIFTRSDANLGSPTNFAARVPAILPVSFLVPWDLSGIFFLLVPLASSPLGRRWVPVWARWLLVAVLAVMLVSMFRNPMFDRVGGYVAGGLLAAGFFAIYWWVDVAAVMMAELGYSAAIVAIHFLNQQSPAIQSGGAWTAAVYGAFALAGAAALLWAPPMEVAAEEEVVEIAAEREILATEFAMAREAQQRLLPAVPPRLDGFSLAASCHPARDVGGDLYDFFRFPDGSYFLCVADVSGKGVPAALYMTMTKGILAAASHDPADLPALASALNAQIHAASRKKTFVTMALGRLDVTSRQLEYSRAGHNSILWQRASMGGACEYRKPRGVGLGLTTSRIFDRAIEVETLALGAGDVVVFYSDGITEAMNASRELFGEDRLAEVVRTNAGLDAGELERAILHEVRAFMAGEPPHDDMTLLIVRA